MAPPEVAAAPVDRRRGFASVSAHQEGLLAVLVAAVLWSSGGLFIKWVDIDALSITMWRSGFAFVTVLVVSRPAVRAPWREERITWAIALSYASTLVLFVSATRLTTAANAIFLQYTAPIYLIGTSFFFLRERVTRLDLGTVALAFAGMGLFFVGRLEAEDTAGNVMALASGVALAAMFTFFRHPSCETSVRPRSMVLGNGLLVVGLLAVNAGRGAWDGFTPSLFDIAGVAFLGVVQIGIAYAIFGFGIARVAALEAALIGMLEPVLNPIWVFLFLGETPGWWAVLGGAVIIATVTGRTVILERRANRR